MTEFAIKERDSFLGYATQALPLGSRIVDVGCGNGWFKKYLTNRGFVTAGLDISFEALQKARSNEAKLLLAGSIEDGMPFKDNSFTGVFSSEVLEHIFPIHGALIEFSGILMQDGLLSITVLYHGIIKKIAIAIAEFERQCDTRLSHIRFFTKRSLASK